MAKAPVGSWRLGHRSVPMNIVWVADYAFGLGRVVQLTNVDAVAAVKYVSGFEISRFKIIRNFNFCRCAKILIFVFL